MTRSVFVIGMSALLTASTVCAQAPLLPPGLPRPTPPGTIVNLPAPALGAPVIVAPPAQSRGSISFPDMDQARPQPTQSEPQRRTEGEIDRFLEEVDLPATRTIRNGRPGRPRLPAHLRPALPRSVSLWDRRKPSKTFLFYDVQARQVGDLLTVLIVESTGVANTESRALSKESEDSGLLNLATTTGGDFGTSSADLQGSGRGEVRRGFDGSATFNSNRQFNDRITVTVMDILPNGNLIIAGRRKLLVAGDERILNVSGVVRPVDIRADNSVTSRLVAGLQVSYSGNGVESQFTNQGWLSKVSNKLWPF